MSGIFGQLGLNDTEYVFAATEGQEVIYTLIQQHLDRVNADVMAAMEVFVSMTTENHKERYKLPGGGYLQSLGQNPQGRADAVKTYGGYDVAYPLEEWGAQVSGTRVSMAYMTTNDLERHIKGVVERDIRTVRRELLQALFINTADTFVDIKWGSLSIQPLANGDTVVYPPVVGSGTEATEDHYLESGYLAAAISETNNPYVTIRDDLVHHYNGTTTNNEVAVFINSAQLAVTEELNDYTPVTNINVIPGTQTATLTGMPVGHPGTLVGSTDGCWVIVWDWVPASYMIGVYLDDDAPLKMRQDPAAVGLGSGLQLVSEDQLYPVTASHWSHRFGFGCGNRLNGVCMELGNGGTYTAPTTIG
jgi:hypothetical protein